MYATKEVDLNPGGADFTEHLSATALLCTKYGARCYFDVDIDKQGEKELIAAFAAKQVRVRIEHPTGHTIDTCKKAGLPPPSSLMICEGFGP